MRIKYMGQTSFLELTHGKEYDVLSIEKGWYRIVDDNEEDYLYPPDEFAVAEGNDGTVPVGDQGQAMQILFEVID